MTLTSMRFVVCLALSFGAGCARHSSEFPLEVRTVAQLTTGNTAQISYVESGDDILVTIVDKSGDSHLHRMSHAGASREQVLEVLRRKQQELEGPVPSSDGETFPFQSVVVSHGEIVVTLFSQPRWLVQAGAEEPRRLEAGESLKLRAGVPIRLFERHVSFRVTAQLESPAGVHVLRTDSMLGEKATRSFFVRAG